MHIKISNTCVKIQTPFTIHITPKLEAYKTNMRK